MNTPAYIGRFAPTPSGYLHFGSLVAALASYLDARAVNGRWLLRMEDLDPPREVPGAQQAILATLESYGLHWDGELVQQSERHAEYRALVERLLERGLAYACTCSRKRLEAYQGIYPGFCRDSGHLRENAAIRLHVPERRYGFDDRVQGHYSQDLAREVGDFVIQRRDGLYAYQLAVVLDDAWQGVTDVVRGADLLDSTPRQIALQGLLGLPTPGYAHLPLVREADGTKLAKSLDALPVDAADPVPSLRAAYGLLGQDAGVLAGRMSAPLALDRALSHFDPERVPRHDVVLPSA